MSCSKLEKIAEKHITAYRASKMLALTVIEIQMLPKFDRNCSPS